MLNFFPDGSLPGGEVGPFQETDVASYEEIYLAAQSVDQNCILQDHGVGFGAVGRSEAIGVFLWGTDSIENQIIRGSTLNGTAASPGTEPSVTTNTKVLVNRPPFNAELSSTL